MAQWSEGETPSSTGGELVSIASPFLLQEECQNYVRVLIVTGRKVFMCGTNAFSPVCSSRQVGAAWGRADRGSLTQAHSLRTELPVQHANQNKKDAQLDAPFKLKTDIILV